MDPPSNAQIFCVEYALRNVLALLGRLLVTGSLPAAERLNVLIITVDDMSADSVGAFGCKLAGTSPNIDRLAKEGMRFRHAHVQVGNCMPSRNVMWSGRYPHNNRVEGFYQVQESRLSGAGRPDEVGRLLHGAFAARSATRRLIRRTPGTWCSTRCPTAARPIPKMPRRTAARPSRAFARRRRRASRFAW